jgi:hypothetical protein
MNFVPNRIFISLVMFLVSLAANAAASNPPPPSSPPPPPGSPLDGGILILLVISITYGLYKIASLNRKKASN